MFWNKPTALALPALQVMLDQEYAQTALLIRSGMDFCADLIPESCGILPDFAAVVRQGYALAGRAGSLQRLDELWADPKVRRRAASLCFPHNIGSRLLRRAVNETPDLTPAEYRQLRQDAMLVQQESLPPLSTLSAMLVCTNRTQAEGPLLDFLSQLPPCLQPEASAQMAAQVLTGCFAAQFLCLCYARSIDVQSELGAILTNAGREYDLLERIVEVTYPIYQRYYTGCTGGETLNREEYGMLLFFWYRDRMESPLRRLALELSPLPPAFGQTTECWLEETLQHAISLRHQEFLEMEDNDFRRYLLALLCSITPHPDLDESCALLLNLNDLAARLREGAFTCRMDEQRTRLLDGDFTEANRTYAAAHSLEQVENGLQFEEYLSRLFASLGYQVTPTQATGDHGVDLVLSKNAVRYALQAKFYTGKVGNKAVQEVYAGMGIWGATTAVVVTTSAFTPQARQDAACLGVVLVDGEELRRLIDLSGTAAGFAHRFTAESL